MKKIIIFTICFCLLPSLTFAQEVKTTEIEDAVKTIRPSVRILNSKNFTLEKEFYPFEIESTVEGLNIATADLDKDGFKEIIVAAGRNEKPLIKIFNHLGEFQYQFLAYAPTFTKGVKVIVADLYNDGSPEIITAPLDGGGPQIRIFDNLGFVLFSFFAFDENLRGGANVAVGDVNGNGQKEIVVGAGYGMEPMVRIFDNYSNKIKEFLVYEETFTGGVNVLTADFDNNTVEDIIVAPYIGKGPLIKIYDFKENLLNKFYAYTTGFGGGVNLAKSDVDQDGFVELVTGAGFSGGAHLRFFDNQGKPKINPKLFVYDDFKGGISITDGDLNNDGKTEIIVATQTISTINKYDFYKIIEIDLTKQTMFVYFKGLVIDEFIVSTGTWKYPTPEGKFKILGKFPSVHMSGFYGPGNPDNYDLPGVPHVMSFYKNYAIHGAYWHWKFGTRVSHGCVNLKIPDAKKLYDWADYGTPVIIYSSTNE